MQGSSPHGVLLRPRISDLVTSCKNKNEYTNLETERATVGLENPLK